MAARKKAAKKDKKEEISFEKSLEALEEIVRRLEGEDLGIEEAMEAYEKGLKALKRCRAVLDRAEKKLEVLVEEEEGRAVTKPFAPGEAESGEGRTGPRSRKKKEPEDEEGPKDGFLF